MNWKGGRREKIDIWTHKHAILFECQREAGMRAQISHGEEGGGEREGGEEVRRRGREG